LLEHNVTTAYSLGAGNGSSAHGCTGEQFGVGDKPSSSLQFFNTMQDDEAFQKKWRSDYYSDWATESIFQESDCLDGE